MVDPLLVYALVGLSILLSAIAAAGAWRSSPKGSGITEAKLEEALAALKGGLVSELARARAAVESGMRDSEEAYADAQQVLSHQVDAAVDRMRNELMAANQDGVQSVQCALDEVFQQARWVQERNLDDQATLLKDLKGNYERALAELRAAVNQSSARQTEALTLMTEHLRVALGDMAREIERISSQNCRIHDRLEALIQLQDARLLERI